MRNAVFHGLTNAVNLLTMNERNDLLANANYCRSAAQPGMTHSRLAEIWQVKPHWPITSKAETKSRNVTVTTPPSHPQAQNYWHTSK